MSKDEISFLRRIFFHSECFLVATIWWIWAKAREHHLTFLIEIFEFSTPQRNRSRHVTSLFVFILLSAFWRDQSDFIFSSFRLFQIHFDSHNFHYLSSMEHKIGWLIFPIVGLDSETDKLFDRQMTIHDRNWSLNSEIKIVVEIN